MAAGQPTKYKPEYAQRLLDFFGAARISDNGQEYKASLFPTLARFACDIGVHRETLINWANQKDKNDQLVNPEFFDAYRMAKEFQEAYIYEGALVGAVNPTFAIWTAKAILGHRDGDSDKDQEPQPLNITINTVDASVERQS